MKYATIILSLVIASSIQAADSGKTIQAGLASGVNPSGCVQSPAQEYMQWLRERERPAEVDWKKQARGNGHVQIQAIIGLVKARAKEPKN